MICISLLLFRGLNLGFAPCIWFCFDVLLVSLGPFIPYCIRFVWGLVWKKMLRSHRREQ